MNFKLLFILSVITIRAVAELFYGNPAEECPPPFRLYTMTDYLYWQASEANLEYVLRQRSTSSFGVQTTISSIDSPFKSGFRVGGGLVFPINDWQLEVDWTRFYRNLRDLQEQTINDNPALVALWMSPMNHDYLSWRNASFSWDLKFDTLDFDLLRVGFADRNFSFTPRIGLTRPWIKQFFHIRYAYATSLPNAFYDVRFSNDFRGIGPRLGFDTQIWAIWGFNLKANAATALVYGSFRAHRIDVSSQFANVNMLEKIDRFKPMVQTAIALEWVKCLWNNSFRILMSLGYETQIWWGQNQLRTFISSSLPPSNFKANSALTLQGLDVHARFDF